MPLVPVILGAVLAALARELGSDAAAEPVVALGSSAILIMAALAVSYRHSRTHVARIVRERGTPASFRRYAIGGKALLAALLGGYWLALDQGSLVAVAREHGDEVAALVLFAPWLAACFALWTGTFLGERAAINGRADLRSELVSKVRRALVPTLVLATGGALVSRVVGIAPVREALDLYPHARPLLFGGAVLAAFAWGPLILRILSPSAALVGWGESLPGWLAPVAKKLRYREWDLGFPIATAAIAGLSPRRWTIFVTPALRRTLEPQELGAVVGHELGHGALGHLAARAAFAVLLVVTLDDASTLLGRAFPDDPITPAVVLGGAILVATLAFVSLARRLEHDADLFAAELGGSAVIVAALGKACDANGLAPESGGLLHPSPRARIALVERVAADRDLGTRRLELSRLLVRAVIAVACIASAAVGVELGRDVLRPPRERLIRAAEARLENGDRELARGYVDRAIAVREDARALVVRARTWADTERAAALGDLERAGALAVDAGTKAAIERARIDLTARRW